MRASVSAIFSIPEIATVGQTSQTSNIKLNKGMFSYQANGKALALGEENGLGVFYSDSNDLISSGLTFRICKNIFTASSDLS
jgi:pyruvate/2-oxoglutarate dehydrogenase complex dihydrolipoamide dehydrogenase (E3) component